MIHDKTWFDRVYTIWLCTCLDDHNSGYFYLIKPKFTSNVNEDAKIVIDALNRDELIRKTNENMKNHQMMINKSHLLNDRFHANYV